MHTAIQTAPPRFDIYQGIHKGLRAFMADTLVRVGRTDPTDSVECAETASALRSLLHVCLQHLTHENDFLHAAMEARAPGSASIAAGEHDAHLLHIVDLGRMLEEALAAAPAQQMAAWTHLYQTLSLFVADNYEHMLMEEREHNAVLWAHYTDAEIHDIHDRLLATIPADEMALTFRWILPQLSHPERVGMLSGMRQGMPDEVFVSQLDMARPLLDARSWRKLQAAFKVEVALHG
ncbi:MAG: hemerythrin domain-containing protein [Aquabacterium sp.]